jgi:hypothetical protein
VLVLWRITTAADASSRRPRGRRPTAIAVTVAMVLFGNLFQDIISKMVHLFALCLKFSRREVPCQYFDAANMRGATSSFNDDCCTRRYISETQPDLSTLLSLNSKTT